MSRILITGCSKGLGRATAIELARRGHEVIATARNPETLIDLPAAARLALDVTDAESVRGAAEAAGTVDVLVNNAAEIAIGPLESIPFEEVRRLYEPSPTSSTPASRRTKRWRSPGTRPAACSTATA
jgi:NAD(P)-dependent dehydrogenase (short-subunit alcohol dehydrogenase family)